jgi:alpha-tubulin suppressor-like RCC1 family protein
VWTWGSNSSGQLGCGQLPPAVGHGAKPRALTFPRPARHVAVHVDCMHALLDDGTVRGWGGNGNGQVGDGTLVTRPAPVLVAALSNIVALGGGGLGGTAVSADGKLFTWGANNSQQLANGTAPGNYGSVPGAVSGLGGGVQIASGLEFQIARITGTPALAPASVGNLNARVGATVRSSVVLTNTGSGVLQLRDLILSGTASSEWNATAPMHLPGALAPGAAVSLTLLFTPGAVGPRPALLTLITNAVVPKTEVPLSGTGL